MQKKAAPHFGKLSVKSLTLALVESPDTTNIESGVALAIVSAELRPPHKSLAVSTVNTLIFNLTA